MLDLDELPDLSFILAGLSLAGLTFADFTEGELMIVKPSTTIWPCSVEFWVLDLDELPDLSFILAGLSLAGLTFADFTEDSVKRSSSSRLLGYDVEQEIFSIDSVSKSIWLLMDVEFGTVIKSSSSSFPSMFEAFRPLHPRHKTKAPCYSKKWRIQHPATQISEQILELPEGSLYQFGRC
nr:unnamed protein product [Callosobruchus analis]